MKKAWITASALSVALAGVAFADDAQSIHSQYRETDQYTAGVPVNTSSATPGMVEASTSPVQQPGMPISRTMSSQEITVVRNNPPLRWSVLEGEVTHVDKINNVVEIQLKGSKQTVGVPVVAKKVGIYRHGDHQYALNDLEPGDDVTIRNLETSAPAL